MIGTLKGVLLAVAGAMPFFVLCIWRDVPGPLFLKVCAGAVVLAAVATMIRGNEGGPDDDEKS